MENKYENIEKNNEKIFDLIHEEFQNENINKEIKLMVANKINNTNFFTLSGVSKLSSLFANGVYYMFGVALVAGAISIFYFSSNNKDNIISNKPIADKNLSENFTQKVETSEQKESIIVDENKNQVDLIASNDSKIIERKSETELIAIETEEFQHAQSIKINNDISDDYIQESFAKIMNKLGLNFKAANNGESIILKTDTKIGFFDNLQVEYYITLKFSKVDRDKVVATLNFIQSSDNKNKFDLNKLFYEELTSELQKYF